MRLWTVPVGLGAVSVVARPLGDEFLTVELEEVRAAGVDVLISLLSQAELPVLGLLDEELAAPFVGLRFLHLPTADQLPPPSDPGTLALAAELAAEVRGGGHVAVHCHAGNGRSPAFAGAILVLAGIRAEDAIRQLSRARGKAVPHRAVQRAWVHWVEHQVLQA